MKDLSKAKYCAFLSPVSTKDGDKEQELAAEALILNRDVTRSVAIELWTNGSVGEIPIEFNRYLQHEERYQ